MRSCLLVVCGCGLLIAGCATLSNECPKVDACFTNANAWVDANGDGMLQPSEL